MSRAQLLTATILTGTLLLAGGCASRPPAPQQASAHSPCNRLAPAKPAPAEVDQRRTTLYHYAICYPQLGANAGKLMPALRAWAARQREAFLKIADQPRPQPWTFELLIDFRVVARGEGFVSVLARGYAYTGGAHGMPLLAGFTLAGNRLVRHPDALFTEPQQARAALSAYARKILGQRAAGGDTAWCFTDKSWLRQGSAPDAMNYAIATFIGANDYASGLRIYFTPYQIAPYACGVQTADVPANVFRRWLKPDYRTLFAEPDD